MEAKNRTASDQPPTPKKRAYKKKTDQPTIAIKGFVSRDNDALKRAATEIGNRLYSVRMQRGQTQREVAQALGLNTMTYSRYENGNRIPDADICAKFVTLFKVDANWLLFGIENKSNTTERHPTKEQQTASNYVSVPVYELANSKHPNELTMGDPVENVFVPKSMIHEKTVAVVYREANMAPNIMPGAIVGMNTEVDNIPMGHAYAVWVPNAGSQIFKAYAKSFSEITLRSDNPSTPDLTLNQEQLREAIVGKVEWLFQVCQ